MASAAAGDGDGAFCPGCGRARAECPGCVGASDTSHYCPHCGRWLAVQVTPTGWRSTCRGCGTTVRGTHQ